MPTQIRSLDFAVLIVLSMLCGACNTKHVSNQAQYLSWLNNPDHGLVRSRTVGNLTVKAKYLPPELRAYQELSTSVGTGESKRDVLERCNKCVEFMLTIEGRFSSRRENADVIVQGISSYQEFADRCMQLNFGISELIYLVCDGKRHSPVLSTLDSDYGVGSGRNIILVFANNLEGSITNAHGYDLVFEDNILGTGIHHFQFSQKDIQNRMRLDF